jgi:uncharacterized protein (TIGR03067 family)
MRILWLGSVCILTAIAPAQDDAVKKDLKAFQGTWKLVAMEVDGQEVAADKLSGATLKIQDKKYSLTTGKQLHEVEITLDPGKKPKEIDMKFLDGPNKDRVGRGIYQIEGDTLKICRALDPQEARPQDFKTACKNGYFTIVWQRESR